MKRIETILSAYLTNVITLTDAYGVALRYGYAKYWLVEYAKLFYTSKGLSCEDEIKKVYENKLDEFGHAEEEYNTYYWRMNKVVRWCMDKVSKQKV